MARAPRGSPEAHAPLDLDLDLGELRAEFAETAETTVERRRLQSGEPNCTRVASYDYEVE